MSEDLKTGIVRILRPDGSTAGTGFLVNDSGLIVTCSHVVQDYQLQGKQVRPDKVTVVFRASGESRETRIIPEVWSGVNADDVAFLQCDIDLPQGAKPLPLGSSTGSKGHRFETFGFPDANSVGGAGGTGELGGPTDIPRYSTDTLRSVLQISSTEVTRGFSGAPVWDAHTACVIGMITVIAPPDPYGRLSQTAFITPIEILKAICPNLPLLRLTSFDWLNQWPSGFTGLDDRKLSGFRVFLHSEQLPYFARDSWQPPPGMFQRWTETSLVEELTQAEVYNPVIVLTGPGGAGKTRLALEIARRMRGLGWLTVHCDGLRATTAGLRQLLAQSTFSVKVLLFVDYLEIWRDSFDAFVSEVLDLDELSGHHVRMIATCRASYRERLPLSIKSIVVGDGSSIEAAYSNAVIVHILGTLGAADTESLAQKCRHNFALAAFLLFLKQQKSGDFAAEISALREEPTFESWIVKRLQNAGLKNLLVIAAILSACEFPATSFNALANAYDADANDLYRVLVTDKWIEHREPIENNADGPVWAVFHDIFTDVVLSRALATAGDRDDSIDRLLERAVSNGVFRQTFSAFGRLLHSETLASVDWRARLLELERRSPGTLAHHARLLITNVLLAPETRVGLIAANSALREAVESDPGCDIGVALTAAAWSDAHATDIQRDQLDQVLMPLLDAAVVRSSYSNMVLRLAFAAWPDQYKEATRLWIDTHRRLFQTHFLLKAWLDQAIDELKSGKPDGAANVEAVREAVNEWLCSLGVTSRASFVLAPWLDAAAAIGGERASKLVAVIEAYVAPWLAYGHHAVSDEASFVYRSWLDAAAASGGERASKLAAVIEAYVAAWLAYG
ncbi:MAG: trypsin-like peptidase domain-containing protein, partial [Methylocystis sp.]